MAWEHPKQDGDGDKHRMQCGEQSARPTHVCPSRVRPQLPLPRPQMVF